MLILIILALIIFFLVSMQKSIEGYSDLTPYRYHWDIFKCYDKYCVEDKTNKCQEWCENWPQLGGYEKCKVNCLNFADIQNEQLRLNARNFNSNLPLFHGYSLLEDRCDDILPSKPVLLEMEQRCGDKSHVVNYSNQKCNERS